jgi:hypothetical protein
MERDVVNLIVLPEISRPPRTPIPAPIKPAIRPRINETDTVAAQIPHVDSVERVHLPVLTIIG